MVTVGAILRAACRRVNGLLSAFTLAYTLGVRQVVRFTFSAFAKDIDRSPVSPVLAEDPSSCR